MRLRIRDSLVRLCLPAYLPTCLPVPLLYYACALSHQCAVTYRGGFHGGFALVLFFCSLLNWLTCALGLIAGVIVLACSKPPVLQAVEMKDVQVAAD